MNSKLKKLNDLIDQLEKEIENLVKTNKNLAITNAKLQDEVNSLWMMIDETANSDMESWDNVLDNLDIDITTRALLVTKKKVDC